MSVILMMGADAPIPPERGVPPPPTGRPRGGSVRGKPHLPRRGPEAGSHRKKGNLLNCNLNSGLMRVYFQKEVYAFIFWSSALAAFNLISVSVAAADFELSQAHAAIIKIIPTIKIAVITPTIAKTIGPV